jgi:4a-hydroxytetrahydrobiopterin dehydratase
MRTLTGEELQRFLDTNGGWALVNGEITREWTFPGFPEAVVFVNRVAELAEAAGHHPDIDIRYNRVRLALVTHDAGGITDKDTELARQIIA